MDDARFQVLYDFQVRDERLERSAKLLDSINQNVERMTAGLLRLERGSGSAFGRIGEQADRSKRSVIDLAGAVYTVRSAFDIARSTIGAAVNALGQFGDSSIKAFGERTSTIRGYTTFLGGDKGQAELEFYRAQQFAQKTDFTSQTIEQGQSRLLAQGFRGKDLYATLFAASDLAAASPDDKNETLKRVTMALGQIKAKGKLQSEELTGQLAEAGLSTTLVREEIRKALGLKNIGAVDKKISAGEVSADVALPAIQRAILAQLGTRRAGEFSTSSAGSLTSLMSNVEEGRANLLKSFDADEAMPGIGNLKKSLERLGKVFDASGKSGQQLSLTMQALGNTVVNARSLMTDFQASFLDSFGRTFTEELSTSGFSTSGFGSIQAELQHLGDALGQLGTAAAKAFVGVNSLGGGLDGLTGGVLRQVDMLNSLLGGDYKSFARGAARNLSNIPGLGILNNLAGKVGAHFVAGEGEDYAYDYRQYKRSLEGELGATDGSLPGGGSVARNPLDPRIDFGKIRAALAAKTGSGKSKADPGWNVPIWHYEPGAGGSSTLGASALNAVVESQVAGGGSERGRPINVEKIEIVVMGASQSPQDIAHAVHEELVTKLRSLPRAPSLRR